MDCIFCQIVAGKSEGSIIYRDKDTTAFTAIDSISLGHTLVVPNIHVEQIFDLSDEQAELLLITVRKTAEILREKHGSTGMNILHASGKDAQQSVFHLHFHLVPRYPDDGLDLWIKQSL